MSFIQFYHGAFQFSEKSHNLLILVHDKTFHDVENNYSAFGPHLCRVQRVQRRIGPPSRRGGSTGHPLRLRGGGGGFPPGDPGDGGGDPGDPGEDPGDRGGDPGDPGVDEEEEEVDDPLRACHLFGAVLPGLAGLVGAVGARK